MNKMYSIEDFRYQWNIFFIGKYSVTTSNTLKKRLLLLEKQPFRSFWGVFEKVNVLKIFKYNISSD